jgi:hypothetical protein
MRLSKGELQTKPKAAVGAKPSGEKFLQTAVIDFKGLAGSCCFMAAALNTSSSSTAQAIQKVAATESFSRTKLSMFFGSSVWII